MENNNTQKQTNIRKTNIRTILVLVFLLVYAIFTSANIRAEYLYNLELGQQYVDKFMQNMQYNSILFAANFVFLFLFFYVITIFMKKGLRRFFVEENKKMPKLPNKSISLVLSAILTIIMVPEISSKIIVFLNAASFEITDEIFNLDIGYYIFQRPVIEMMLQYVVFIGTVSAIYVAIYYIASLNIYFNGVDINTLKKNIVVKLLIVILMLIVLAIAGIVYIKSEDVLFSKFLDLDNGIELVGAGATDILFKVWGYRILSVVIIISALLIIKYMKNGEKKKAFKAVLIVPAYLLCLFILIIGYQYLFINQNKLDNEYDYIKYNIENTQNAYNIKIDNKELEYSGTINYDEVQNNEYLLNNIPLVDENITLTTLKEYQSKQGYYSYNNTKLLEYNDQIVYVTPREIINSSVTSKANKTYEYTHGFGTIITSATKTDENNGVMYLQSEFENSENQEFVNIEQPRIYFGTSNNNVVIINSNNKQEFDYPISTTQILNNTYEGNAGLKLGFIDRLVLAIKERNISILFANSDSKILLNKNILERVKKILPDLVYDENPYLVINNEGKLVWVVDGYTVSDKYPYSNFTTITVNGIRKDINYIRNSVKVLVDAYEGTVSYYITDRNDPVIMAYRNIYPTLFKELNEVIPADISSHITYPQFLYNVQAKMLNVYHNIKPEVLYRNDDIWEIATYQFSQSTNKATQMAPNYTMVSIKDKNEEKQNVLGLVIPYTLQGKQNLNSYLIGIYDSKTNENKLVLNKFVSNTGILGPKQLERQIDEDTKISKELENISLAGSKIIKNLYVVPINNTIIYVEPIYQILVNESPVPVLKKIIVSSGNKLAIGDNLQLALQNLLSQYAVNIEVYNNDDIEAVIESIIKANGNLKSSSESNNWTLMGQDIQKLQELIEKLKVLKDEQNRILNEEKNNSTDVEITNQINNEITNKINIEEK